MNISADLNNLPERKWEMGTTRQKAVGDALNAGSTPQCAMESEEQKEGEEVKEDTQRNTEKRRERFITWWHLLDGLPVMIDGRIQATFVFLQICIIVVHLGVVR